MASTENKATRVTVLAEDAVYGFIIAQLLWRGKKKNLEVKKNTQHAAPESLLIQMVREQKHAGLRVSF